MLYTEAIDYLYSRLPVFHRIGPKAIKPGLQNIQLLSEALGNPHQQFHSLHIAGTNGKGSTSHMLASIYQQAGYRVGLYTSPHLKSFTERIRINGNPIAEEEVAAFVEAHQSLIETVEPSFFEVTVALAFDYFARQQVDLAIIEVGLGGRLDSTNIITPIASVITNIGYDHMDILGDTLPAIATEKAGIIKQGIPVIIGEYTEETRLVFERVAQQQQSPVYYASEEYTVLDNGLASEWRAVTVQSTHKTALNSHRQYLLDLLGLYQLKNLPAVLTTIDVLQEQFSVEDESVARGLQAVAANTGLKGRFQILGRSPLLIADTAHNQPGIAELLETIQAIPHQQLHIIFGMVADKNPGLVLSILPTNALYYFCEANSPRSLSAIDLQQEAASYNLIGMHFTDVNKAIDYCCGLADVNHLIVVTGSNYLVSEVNSL